MKNVEYKSLTVAPGTALYRALTEKDGGDVNGLYKKGEEEAVALYGKEAYFWMLKYSARKGQPEVNAVQ